MQMNNIELLIITKLLFLIWLVKQNSGDALKEMLFQNKTGPFTRMDEFQGEGIGVMNEDQISSSQPYFRNLVMFNYISLSIIENIVRKLHKIAFESSDYFYDTKVKVFFCDGSFVVGYLSMEWLCLRFFCNGNSGMTRRTRFSLALSLLQICLGTLRAVKRLTNLASFFGFNS